ncbi:MAG: inositol monophosphatase [Rhodospirillales bacterium]|nr:inositol monophosphatase [Rhodospirillales bacterium]
MSLFSVADAQALAGLLRAAARAEVMPRFRRLDAGAVRTKSGPLDLVTIADEAAERAITAALQRRFPGCVVVGEEAAAADASLLLRLAGADLAFVVDPIDGTANYAAGLPLFGVMAAALVRGEIVAAAIHDPLGDDTAMAVRGEGAWTETPDGARRDLRVAAPVPVARMTGAASWRYLPAGLRATVAANLTRVAASFDLRCAAHEYRALAGGHCHFLLFHRLMPWDHAPGWLLHREAGGFAARFDGTPYLPTQSHGGLICTPDEASFRALRAALLEG